MTAIKAEGVIFGCPIGSASSAMARPVTAAAIAEGNAIEKELEATAVVDRKVMVPMRDGKRMAADIYRPKDQSKKYPVIFCADNLQLQLLGWSKERWAPGLQKAVRVGCSG